MKSRLKQQIFAFFYWHVLLYLLPMLCKHIHFVNYFRIHRMKQSLGLFGTGCLVLYPKKVLLLIWKQ